MRGYVAQRRNRFYAVIYEGIDPITGGSVGDGIPPAPTRSKPKNWQRHSLRHKVNASAEDERARRSAST